MSRWVGGCHHSTSVSSLKKRAERTCKLPPHLFTIICLFDSGGFCGVGGELPTQMTMTNFLMMMLCNNNRVKSNKAGRKKAFVHC